MLDAPSPPNTVINVTSMKAFSGERRCYKEEARVTPPKEFHAVNDPKNRFTSKFLGN